MLVFVCLRTPRTQKRREREATVKSESKYETEVNVEMTIGQDRMCKVKARSRKVQVGG